MNPEVCKQLYTKVDVKKLLEFNEGSGAKTTRDEHRQVCHTIHGPMTITMRTGAPSGHARSRHLMITEDGLRDRTTPAGDDPGLPMASAFLSNKYENLVFCLTQLLNSDKGQLALGYLDLYRDRGKTRVVVTETASTLRCTQINTRVFYQGHDKSTSEKVEAVTAVIDSNLGGGLPLRIVTCFPSKEATGFSVGLPSALQEARDCTAAFERALAVPASWGASGSPELALADRVLRWMAKSYKSLPPELVPSYRQFAGKAILLGTRFNDAWFRPHEPLYEFVHPPAKLEVAIGEPLAFQKLDAPLPHAKLFNTGVFTGALKTQGKAVEIFDNLLLHRMA